MLTSELITTALQKHYTKRANETRDTFPITGSSFGHCPRRLSALIAGLARVPLSYKAGRTFEDGHDRGEALAKALSDALPKPWEARRELETWAPIEGVVDPVATLREIERRFPSTERVAAIIEGKLCLRGRIDLCFIDRHGMVAETVEIKGKNSFGMSKLDTEGPGDEYVAQVAFYRRGLMFAKLRVASSHFLFEDKDTQEWVTITMPQDELEDIFTQLEPDIADVLNDLGRLGPQFTGYEGPTILATGQEGKLPWQCNYCAVGPKTGQCCPGKILIDNRKPGKLVPAWEAR